AASPASVHTRGRTLRSTGGRDASSAAAAACSDSSRTLASAALQHFEVEARKRSHYLAARNYPAVAHPVLQKFIVNESGERPAVRRRQRIAQFDERVEASAGAIEILHAVEIVDRRLALPGQAGVDDERLLRLDERPRHRRAHFVTLVTAGELVQRAHL